MNMTSFDYALPENLWSYVQGREELDNLFGPGIEFAFHGQHAPLDLASVRSFIKPILEREFIDPSQQLRARSKNELLHKIEDDAAMQEVMYRHRKAFYLYIAKADPMDAIHLAMVREDKSEIEALTAAQLAAHIKPGVFNVLHMAATESNEDLLQALLKHYPDVNTINQKGETPLHLAAVSGSSECVRALIGSGADTMMQDGYGHSALMTAASFGHEDMVNLLLPLSNLSAVDNEGNTAADFARQDYPEIASLIEGAIHAKTERGEFESISKLSRLGPSKSI